MYRDEWGYREEAMSKGRKVQREKRTRKCRWRIFRFGELSFLDLEIGIQFGSP